MEFFASYERETRERERDRLLPPDEKEDPLLYANGIREDSLLSPRDGTEGGEASCPSAHSSPSFLSSSASTESKQKGQRERGRGEFPEHGASFCYYAI